MFSKLRGRGRGGSPKRNVEEEPPEIDMATGPPQRRGNVMPRERPIRFDDDDDDDDIDLDYEDDDDAEDYYAEMDDVDMGRGDRRMMRPARTDMGMPSEVPYGRPAVIWQIRKKIHKSKGMQKIDEVEDAEPPTRDYIEEEWVPRYGGGTYAIYKDRYIVDKVRVQGDPIYVEDIEAEKRKAKMAYGFDPDEAGMPNMFGFMMAMMQKNEGEIAQQREENRRLMDELRRAELEGIRAEIKAMRESSDSVGGFLKEWDKFERVAEKFRPRGDMVDKVLDNPTFQKMAETMIDKIGEVDFSDPNLFKPKDSVVPSSGVPQQGGPPAARMPTREEYISHIQRFTLSQQVEISPEIIGRAVDIALSTPSMLDDLNDAAQENLNNGVVQLDRLLDARRALYHLKENVLEGKFSEDDAAEYITENMPNYREFLLENNYRDMIRFLDQFDDIAELKPMIQYARADEVKESVEKIILKLRSDSGVETFTAQMPDMSGLEDRTSEGDY